ncbi:MAG: exosortase [Desulfuromonadales bacterium]|nr:exosortase [Desulfuromonadales bacterium]
MVNMTGKSVLSIRQVGFGVAMIWGVFGAMFFAAYLPVMIDLVRAWNGSDDYSHGFLIVPIALYIVWHKRGLLAGTQIAGSWVGLPVAIISLLMYLFARVGEILTLASLSMIGVIAGSVLFLFGFGVLRVLLFPLLLLLFMIPVPAQIYATLTIPLQLLVTKSTASMASSVGIPLYCEGNVIHHSQGTLEVVQACSGLRSIMALLTIGAVFGYFSLRSNVLRLILFISAIPVAVAVNILRVFAMLVAIQFLGIDISKGTPHTILGIALFGVAVAIFVLIRKGLSFWER